MFERFTNRARRVVKQAQVERAAMRHDLVGTEHILLALVGADGGIAGEVLRDAGVNAEDVRRRIIAHEGQGPRVLGDADAAALKEIGIDLDAVRAKVEASFGTGALRPPLEPKRLGRRVRRYLGGDFSPRAKKVLELSLREALRLKHNYIGTEHILLGLIREGGGLGALVLTDAGVSLDDLRERVHTALRAVA
jgi:ATP-dependent Clp protease ATP-binding subunit ClpA